MDALKKVLDGNIVDHDGKTVAFDTVFGAGKYVGLYFSAHWCPPCKMFTPQLGDYYKKMKEDTTKKPFEIIFVSSDKDADTFNTYYKEMPWLTLNFEKRDEKATLSSMFKVAGIPTLVILNGEDGETITTKGRTKLASDPEGFPWVPKSLGEILYSGDFIKKDGTKVKADEIKNKIKAIYFSAHWCPPCRAFTPKLIQTYNKLKESGKEFEIIFASSDRDDKSFNEYFGTMPWLALPLNDPRKDELSDHCDVEGIPTLVVYNAEDKKITGDGRSAVAGDPEGKEFPWLPKPINILSEDTAAQINDSPCLVILTDGKPESIESAKGLMKESADKYFNEDQDKQNIFFFYSEEEDDLVESLKKFAKISDDVPQMLIMDIPSQKVYEFKDPITPESVAQLVADYLDKKLEGRALR